MTKNNLALLGGKKTINKKFKKYNSIGVAERMAVQKVMKHGQLSGFLADWETGFDGGKEVKSFENEWSAHFNVKHSIMVNSWTSGLVAMMGAIQISPGDEVIVPPWTMCASATAIVFWGGIPVFADIEEDFYCIDPVSVRRNITKKTKAILAVDIFGQSSNILELRNIALEFNLKLLCDTAQSPGSKINDSYSGTLGDIGGFSLNYHKHIHTGEGGVLVTNDDELALRLKLIRNHGEASVQKAKTTNIVNILGGNYRMGEIEAAIGRVQLQNLTLHLQKRIDFSNNLNKELSKLEGLNIPKTRNNCTHVFYTYPILIDIKKIGISRSIIIKALAAEGINGLAEGYANIHLLPMYQNKIALGNKGFPWTYKYSRKEVNYNKGICPIAETYHDNSFLNLELAELSLTREESKKIVLAFKKVWKNFELLKSHE